MGQPLFPLLRPAYENTPELATLASQVRADSESNGNLERQIEFDNKVARELSSLSLTGSQVNEIKFMLSTSDLDMESKNLINTMNPEETEGQLHPSKAAIQAGGVERRKRMIRKNPPTSASTDDLACGRCWLDCDGWRWSS